MWAQGCRDEGDRLPEVEGCRSRSVQHCCTYDLTGILSQVLGIAGVRIGTVGAHLSQWQCRIAWTVTAFCSDFARASHQFEP